MDLTFGFLLYDCLFVWAVGILTLVGYFKYSYMYWKNKGVPYLEPSFPYGNYMYWFSKSPILWEETKSWYNRLKERGLKFGGVWMFSQPILILVDPNYIRDILTKDFNHFIDRDMYVNDGDLRGTNLFNISSNGWKPLRQKLTPTFTSGKMKAMFASVLSCSDPMVEFLKKSSSMGEDINIRAVLASFTTDVIFSVAFGVNSNSFSGKDTEVLRQGREIFKIYPATVLKVFMMNVFPNLARKIGIKLGKETTKQFFAELVKDTMEHRKKNNVRRSDFLQLLMDMNENPDNKEATFTFDEIVANTILFFVAGFDTSSVTMSFALYELAKKPDLQEKARQEITNVLKEHHGVLTYEAIRDMTYLDQVIDETLRIWPPVVSLARICVKDYKLRDTDVLIKKGMTVGISLLGMANDPEYFPNPDRFDPDRFHPENKANLPPYVYMPFGEGPRKCLGLRFGIMQSKIGLAQILTNFRLNISSKTQMPLTINPTACLLKSNEILYLKAEKI